MRLRHQHCTRGYEMIKGYNWLKSVGLCVDAGSQRTHWQGIWTCQCLSERGQQDVNLFFFPLSCLTLCPTKAGAWAMSDNSFLFNYSNSTTVKRSVQHMIRFMKPDLCSPGEVGHIINLAGGRKAEIKCWEIWIPKDLTFIASVVGGKEAHHSMSCYRVNGHLS